MRRLDGIVPVRAGGTPSVRNESALENTALASLWGIRKSA